MSGRSEKTRRPPRTARAAAGALAAAWLLAAAALPGCPDAEKRKDARMSEPRTVPDAVVVMETTEGKIRLRLDGAKAPISTASFLAYVKDRHYDGTIFHRVMPGFMIQGGGFAPDMTQRSTRDAIRNESANGLTNARGTLAMARTNDPHSATAQFFINLADNDFLDRKRAADGWGYAVFGRVVEGMDVVDRIAKVRTRTVGAHEHVPIEPVVITSVRVESGS